MVGSKDAGPNAESSATELESKSCEDLERLLYERIGMGFANGDRSCAEDSDCTLTSPDIGCLRGCTRWLVGRAGGAGTRAAVERDIAPVCMALGGRCALGISSCANGPSQTPECLDGSCRIFDGSALSCVELETQALEHGRALAEAGDRHCTSDGDCSLLFWGSSCVVTCANVVSVASGVVAQLTKDSLRAGSKYCNAYWERPCPEPMAIECAGGVPTGEPHAICNVGQCDVRYVAQP
jgi:hypothetical protein